MSFVYLFSFFLVNRSIQIIFTLFFNCFNIIRNKKSYKNIILIYFKIKDFTKLFTKL
jgi:hypothetical protein